MSRSNFCDCVIGTGVKVEGKVEAPGLVRIDGEFNGNITSGASVIISKDAVVHATVQAKELVVAGAFYGAAEIERAHMLSRYCPG